MTDKPEYLIRKGAYWYRPNCQGYTTNPAQAGRYTLPAALAYTHPNGLDGPRDGLTFMHESDVPIATPQPCASALVEAAKALVTAVRFDDPPKHFNGILCHEARIPVEFVQHMEAALSAWEQSNADVEAVRPQE